MEVRELRRQPEHGLRRDQLTDVIQALFSCSNPMVLIEVEPEMSPTGSCFGWVPTPKWVALG